MKNYLGKKQNELHKDTESILILERVKNRMDDTFYLKLQNIYSLFVSWIVNIKMVKLIDNYPNYL